MTYQRFEELPVWQEAARLYELTENLLNTASFEASPRFRDQLDRAALSISRTIAEGFERGTTHELLEALHTAKGSAGEVRSLLIVKGRRASDASVRRQIEALILLAESCSRQLRGLAETLREAPDMPANNSRPFRSQTEQERRTANLQRQLLELLPAGHPLRRHIEDQPDFDM